ncbi:MAG: flagellar hook-basal body complex protein FliE [Clostridiales bacterium]|jgi:flagellar hook-basal body complex protein FliE|nr:flagellar hook-basal body complex protein FliE [Eubacteriales bacterium]MDH7564996.1 flagellar hook-basal body complex protein FliE [Clostridiales bacterium]
MTTSGISGISNLNPVSAAASAIEDTGGNEKEAKSFAEFLNDAINRTNDLLLQSQQINDDFAAGKTDNIHDVMIASEKADIALQFTMQIRNKILDAYTEIMRMQI